MVEKFKNRFSRLDTIPAVTDSQPSHPVSQPRRRSIYRTYNVVRVKTQTQMCCA